MATELCFRHTTVGIRISFQAFWTSHATRLFPMDCHGAGLDELFLAMVEAMSFTFQCWRMHHRGKLIHQIWFSLCCTCYLQGFPYPHYTLPTHAKGLFASIPPKR